MKDTAIVLFVYNRPDHTSKVLEGLRSNDIQKLHVFSDAPACEEDAEAVQSTRKLVEEIDWCEVEKNYKNENTGLARSIITGITKIFDAGYSKVIVLEDDCIPNKNFVTFMDACFKFYEKIPEVKHISGFGLPLSQKIQYDVYLAPWPCSWGWGTWKKYWQECNFENEAEYKALLSDPKLVEEFNYSGETFSGFLQNYLDGKVNSWQIRWYFHLFKSKARCVWSADSKITNIGFDGTGVHKVKLNWRNQKQKVVKQEQVPYKFDPRIEYDEKIIDEFRSFFPSKSFKSRLKSIHKMVQVKLFGN